MEYLVHSFDILNYIVITIIILGFFFLGLNEYQNIVSKTEKIEKLRFKEKHLIIIIYTLLTIISIIVWEYLFHFFITANKIIGNNANG